MICSRSKPSSSSCAALRTSGFTVDGVDRLGVRVLLHHAADGAKHAVHGLARGSRDGAP